MKFIKSSESSVMSTGGNGSPSVEGVALKLNLDDAGGRGKEGFLGRKRGLSKGACLSARSETTTLLAELHRCSK